MTDHAKGEFEVKLVPQAEKDLIPGFGRMTITKEFRGDLEAASVGQMLSAGTSEPTSAGYVAIERVDGLLQGKKGTFFLQHTGTMNKGEPSLTVSVIPDSGTGELEGISGILVIERKDRKHLYDFEYALP